MENSITAHTKIALLVNEKHFNVEHRSNNGIVIIKWRLPVARELNKFLEEKISKKNLEKLYHKLVKSFLSREFIDLDIFQIPDNSVWRFADDYSKDVYNLPKGRSKVRIDNTDDGDMLICQWHLPSHLSEYFSTYSLDDNFFKNHWDLEVLSDTVLEYIKLIR